MLDGSGFFSGMDGFKWWQVYIAYGFLLTWNVIAMEAAACYIGECADPDQDAKIAMNLEGVYGVFIYTLIPIAFIVVLGAKALSDPALVDPNTIFVTFAGKVFPGIGGEVLNWLIAGMLIVALTLSALNAIMGSRALPVPDGVDGEFPRFFQRTNDHGVPANAMVFNVVVSLLVVLLGGAVEIYSFSNVGYTGLAHPGADRLLPAAPGPAERAPARPPARAVQVRRARRRLLPVRVLAATAASPTPASATPRSTTSSAGPRRPLPPAVPLPDARGGQEVRHGADPAGPVGGGSIAELSAAARARPARCIRGPSCWPPRSASGPGGRSRSAARLAAPSGAPVYVFAIARVHGTKLGFPNPGLLPTRQEWDAQRTSVAKAVKALRRRGLRAQGRVLGTRSAAKKIVQEAGRLGCDAIVMGADPPRSAGWRTSSGPRSPSACASAPRCRSTW